MDEPLSNLDAKLRVQMRIEISKLHQNSRLQFYVTHDQTEAMTMGTKFSNEGRYIQQVVLRIHYTKPDNMFVAGFIKPTDEFINVNLKNVAANVFMIFGKLINFLRKQVKALEETDYIGKSCNELDQNL